MVYTGLDYLKNSYSERKEAIKRRLEEFKWVLDGDNKRIFSELCFCLLTPQSRAKVCDKAVQNLVKTSFLFTGSEKDIKDYLIGVRFNNNKAKYIIEAREMFGNSIKDKIKGFENPLELREWLVRNIKGFGLKEASHFMRNIGRYRDIAILDRHILKNLHKHGVIDEIPETLTNTKYFQIEEKMKKFANDVGIQIEELDLLFWSEETGEIFK